MPTPSRDPLEELELITKQLNDSVGGRTRAVLSRYPILFSLLTIFGVVCILYGFEAAIAKIPFLAERPLVVFLIGIIILVGTGTLYKGLTRAMK